MSCTGTDKHKINQFKLACLNYQPNPVSYQGRTIARRELLALQKVLHFVLQAKMKYFVSCKIIYVYLSSWSVKLFGHTTIRPVSQHQASSLLRSYLKFVPRYQLFGIFNLFDHSLRHNLNPSLPDFINVHYPCFDSCQYRMIVHPFTQT